ncbi:MAG: phospholipase [Betaproteobacteria bacterium]|nr:MAG: phospholipase [Betaproteobacteria bacterium]
MSALPAALLDAMSTLVRQLPPLALGNVVDQLALGAGAPETPGRLMAGGGLSARNQEALAAMMHVWRRDAPLAQGHTVACALHAMAWQDDAARSRLSAELVWTGPEVLGHGLRSTEQRLIELLDSAAHSVWVVAFAAYRIPGIAAALERALDRGVRLAFVVEDVDESQGRVSFDPILAFGSRIANVARVYAWPLDRRPRDARGRYGTLHAKCVVADGTAIFVSSANFTEYAMNLNLELGAMIKSADLAGQAERLLERLVAENVLTKV